MRTNWPPGNRPHGTKALLPKEGERGSFSYSGLRPSESPCLTTERSEHKAFRMVAEGTLTKPIALAAKRPKIRRARIPLPLRTKVCVLYTVRGMSPAAIAVELKGELTRDQIASMAIREGWTAKQKVLIRRTKEEVDARTRAATDEITNAIASECEDLTFSALTRTRQSLESGHENAARDFRSYAGGLRDLVTIARTCRGLDLRNDGADTRGATTLNVFVGRFGPSASAATPEVKNVTPVIETEANAIELPKAITNELHVQSQQADR